MNELHPHEASTDNQHSWKPISELTESEAYSLFMQLVPSTDAANDACEAACEKAEIGNCHQARQFWLDALSMYEPVAIG